jgi:hypothetical protein
LYCKLVAQKKKKARFKIGDKVRVSVKKLSVGKKSYTDTYGPEIVTIIEVVNHNHLNTFKLAEEKGVTLEGGFNEFELIRITVPQE